MMPEPEVPRRIGEPEKYPPVTSPMRPEPSTAHALSQGADVVSAYFIPVVSVAVRFGHRYRAEDCGGRQGHRSLCQHDLSSKLLIREAIRYLGSVPLLDKNGGKLPWFRLQNGLRPSLIQDRHANNLCGNTVAKIPKVVPSFVMTNFAFGFQFVSKCSEICFEAVAARRYAIRDRSVGFKVVALPLPGFVRIAPFDRVLRFSDPQRNSRR
jgi:hypothetical protein